MYEVDKETMDLVNKLKNVKPVVRAPASEEDVAWQKALEREAYTDVDKAERETMKSWLQNYKEGMDDVDRAMGAKPKVKPAPIPVRGRLDFGTDEENRLDAGYAPERFDVRPGSMTPVGRISREDLLGKILEAKPEDTVTAGQTRPSNELILRDYLAKKANAGLLEDSAKTTEALGTALAGGAGLGAAAYGASKLIPEQKLMNLGTGEGNTLNVIREGTGLANTLPKVSPEIMEAAKVARSTGLGRAIKGFPTAGAKSVIRRGAPLVGAGVLGLLASNPAMAAQEMISSEDAGHADETDALEVMRNMGVSYDDALSLIAQDREEKRKEAQLNYLKAMSEANTLSKFKDI